MSNFDIDFLAELEQIVHTRLTDNSDGSYTASLANAGIKRIAQKVGEEGVELALAAAAGDDAEVLEESADLLYHVIVLLAAKDLRLKDVCERLRARHSGA